MGVSIAVVLILVSAVNSTAYSGSQSTFARRGIKIGLGFMFLFE